MPAGIRQVFLDRVENVIRRQLKGIGDGADEAARFAQQVHPARSTTIRYPVENTLSGSRSKVDPSALVKLYHDLDVIHYAMTLAQRRVADHVADAGLPKPRAIVTTSSSSSGVRDPA
ncbi:hypothetical protein BDV95DRAFT_604146 [Massariosphaeria phaeospora]|uniref:Uncharacterized protein n=1 Tax=Massariosphaeria phaeospora TaxID=100035 RepID=A0A7C8IEV2_9PLEO|nr:hypothetical protein BDV95DRAFT_604146 [Massariosphaeria phaeospora]